MTTDTRKATMAHICTRSKEDRIGSRKSDVQEDSCAEPTITANIIQALSRESSLVPTIESTQDCQPQPVKRNNDESRPTHIEQQHAVQAPTSTSKNGIISYFQCDKCELDGVPTG